MFYILSVCIGILFFVADRLTKIYIASDMVLGQSRDFIPGLIDIVYVHNDGGAWGMLGGYTWLLLSVTVVVMLVCIALLVKYGVKNKLMFMAIILVLSGGLGNMIDRIFLGFVVDFIDFYAFPNAWVWVFNVADSFVCVGAGLMMLYIVLDAAKEMKRRKLATQKTSEGDDENV